MPRYFFVIVACCILFVRLSHAQFLPGAYMPQIGVPGQIDTIYGWDPVYGGFGQNLMNIGPPIYGGYSSIASLAFPNNDVNFQSFAGGPSFNLHKLHFDGRLNSPLALNQGYEIRHIGPIRTSRSHDIVLVDHTGSRPPRIYWEADDGTYDSTHYTVLDSYESLAPNASTYYLAPVFGRFRSDTVEDVIFESKVLHKDFDTLFLNFTSGGSQLEVGPKYKYVDSICTVQSFNQNSGPAVSSYLCSGDFRDSKRTDLLRLALSDTAYKIKNLLFVPVDRPFSLSRIASQWNTDTLLAEWQNPGLRMGAVSWSLQALEHGQDGAEDAMLRLVTVDKQEGFYIFRGGPDFGSHRLTVDSAAFVIPHPGSFDPWYKNLSFIDLKVVGDISGKGVPMLCTQYAWGNEAYYFIYGLQRGISDRASVFFSVYSGGGTYDSVTADRDGIEDVIFGQPGFSNNGTSSGKGAIFVLHGSKSIPIEGLGVDREHQKDRDFSIYPNPSSGRCSAIINVADDLGGELTVRNILGEAVYRQHVTLSSGSRTIPLDLSLASGSYHVTLQMGSIHTSSLLVIAR